MNGNSIFTTDKANDYISENSGKINQEFRPLFHFSAPCGWINDPNGFSYFNGKYHLFYQFHPYSSKWGPMHWGHAISDDLIRWEHLPVALAPDSPFDKDGCFSGTAIVREGKLYLVYTGVHGGKQEQCVAYSEDGVKFTKYADNPVIGEKNLGGDMPLNDFRDPKIFISGSDLYCAVGTRTGENGRAAVYKAINGNIFEWEYKGNLLAENFGVMFECPDIFETDGETAIISSIIGIKGSKDKKYKFISGATPTYIILGGDKNYDNLPKPHKYYDEIDSGFDFYAPQTVTSPENKVIMTAWLQAWGKSIPTDYLNHGWSCSMCLPREISVKNNRLIQQPVKTIESYRKNEVVYKDIIINNQGFSNVNSMPFNFINGILTMPEINGKTIEIIISADVSDISLKQFSVLLFAGENNNSEEKSSSLTFDKQRKAIIFDRTGCGYDMRSENEKESNADEIRIIEIGGSDSADSVLNLRIFIDISAVEIFINNGEKTISSRIYPKTKDYCIKFKSDGKVKFNEIRKYDIII